MSKLNSADQFAIAQVYPRYAQAIDEKRFDLLDGVFHPDAEVSYVVGPHEFSCSGADAARYFGDFLQYCYWTNHLIAPPLVESCDDGATANARVIATHIQHLNSGGENRWTLRGSYHDRLINDADGWRIVARYCVCTDSEGEFLNDGVERYETLAWGDPERL